MLTNATILRITAPNPATTGGLVTYTPAATTLAIRCALGSVSRERRYELGAQIADATAMLRVETPDLGGRVILADYQVQVRLDGRAAETYLVVLAKDNVKDDFSNVMAFLRKP